MRASLNKVMSSRSLEMVVCLLIVGSLIAYTVSTLPDLNETGRRLAVRIELAISAIFTLEYVLRVFSTPKPLRYTLYGGDGSRAGTLSRAFGPEGRGWCGCATRRSAPTAVGSGSV